MRWRHSRFAVPAVILGILVNGTAPVPAVAPPPPSLAPAPPPPQLPAAPLPPPPVNTLSDNPGDSLVVPGTHPQAGSPSEGGATPIPAPPAVPVTPPAATPPPAGTSGSGGGVAGTGDEGDAAALANANDPDLSDLPGWELVDPFGVQEFAVTNPSLKGGAALAAIAQACSDYGVDTRACAANVLHEGAGGGIGDSGLAYGPFQDHLTQYPGRPFYGKGANNAVVNAWAWTENGIRYSIRQMATAKPSARGLTGHAAVYAIVYGYERPGDEAGAYKTRAAEYDRLVALGSGWASAVAAQLKGPAAGGGVDTAPLGPPATEPYAPAGVVKQWRGVVDFFKVTVPARRRAVDSLGKSIVEVMK